MKSIFALVLMFWLTGCASRLPPDYALCEGDVLFQSMPYSPLVEAIEGITSSPYSHCGIVAKSKAGQWVVIEAIGPVRETPISNWIDQGRRGWFEAYRLSPEFEPKIPLILAAARKYLGRPYDIHYSFDDKRIYCSELIFKAVLTATGKKLGKVERLGDLNWKPHERFIRSIEGKVPLDRAMITPRSLAEAPELTKVYAKPR